MSQTHLAAAQAAFESWDRLTGEGLVFCGLWLVAGLLVWAAFKGRL